LSGCDYFAEVEIRQTEGEGEMIHDDRLVAAIERAEREVARLVRDVEKLLERTQDANPRERIPKFDLPAVGGARPTYHGDTPEARIAALRDSVKNSEYGISAIRAILDDTEKLLIAGLLKRK
jgi:hypothetical protein